jgi:hypothetical protein
MGVMNKESGATAPSTKDGVTVGVSRHGRLLLGLAVVSAIGVSPSVVRHSETSGQADQVARVDQIVRVGQVVHASLAVEAGGGDASGEPVFRQEALLDPAPALESRRFGLAALGNSDPLMEDAPAGYALRPLGQAAVLRFSLSPVASYTSIAERQPDPAVPDIVTGSIPKEPEAVTRLASLAPEGDLSELEIPLPLPRPEDAPGLLDAAPPPQNARSTPAKEPEAAEPDDRNFIQRFFGSSRSSEKSLAYAPVPAAPRGETSTERRSLLPSLFGSTARPGTAVYDISARTVYLPSGEKLEAHSGLGDKRDDPRHVNVRMHGPTPPHVYDLTEREKLFHGVAALRLNPVGGSGAIYGRVGLLAHSYLLGPNGDSNGCVSVKDYNRFLQAYRRGEIKRLVVVN